MWGSRFTGGLRTVEGARRSRHRANPGLFGLLPRDHRENPMPTVSDVENELVRECLVVFLAELLVPLRKVIPRLNLHALEGSDELWRVITTAETGLLHSEPEEIHAFVVRLDIAVRREPVRVELLRQLDDLPEPLPVVRRVEGALEDRQVTVDADKPFDLCAEHR